MYVIGSLTASDWAKIQPGLHNELQHAIQVPADATISRLSQFVSCLDIWAQTVDGHQYWVRAANMPPQWTKAQWIDFVVTLAKTPTVAKVGMLCENAVQDILMGIGLAPQGESSPSALLQKVSATSSSGRTAPSPISGSGSGTLPYGGGGTKTSKVMGMSMPTLALIAGGGLLLIALMKRR